MAALLIMMSLALIFAEATIITDGKPDLSMFSLMIKSAGDNETLVQVRGLPAIDFSFPSQGLVGESAWGTALLGW